MGEDMGRRNVVLVRQHCFRAEIVRDSTGGSDFNPSDTASVVVSSLLAYPHQYPSAPDRAFETQPHFCIHELRAVDPMLAEVNRWGG